MTKLNKIIELLNIQNIIDKLSNLEKEDMISKLDNLTNSVYPFSDYEFIISNLLWMNKMTLDEYEDMRETYIQRNRHLDKFQMAWKSVWKWAEDIMVEWDYWLKKPSKKIDPNYSQQTSYDAYTTYEWNLVRIEIKAARVSEAWNDYDFFADKALFSDSNKPFRLNFQQLKPQLADVFVFIAIYRDKLKYRVLSSHEVKHYGEEEWQLWRFSPWQHSWNAWNEWQLHIRDTNISDFNKYLTTPSEIKDAIIDAYKRNKSETIKE